MSRAGINYMSHLFYIDPSENEYLPPWFLELATREEAEKMLRSRSDGNVLMRSHPSFESTGKYVITYEKEAGSFRHYLLRNTPDGFRLDIDHKNNRPVNCLSEALDLFVKLSGRSVHPIIGDNVSRNLPSSAGHLQTSHNYINTPQTSVMWELNRNVPSSSETLGSVQPIHNYLNQPQLSTASSSSNFCPEEPMQQHNTKEPRSYVNLQQLSLAEETCFKKPGFMNRPLTSDDDAPTDFAPPPPPEWN